MKGAGQLSLPHSSSASRFTAGAAITSQAKCELDHLVANSLPLSFAARSIGLQADMHKVIARVTWSALLAAAISLVFCTTGLTHEDWPDGPHKEWFKNLQRPDNAAHPHRRLDHKSLFCCGAADVVKTKFMVEPGGDRYPDDVWYAWLNNTWTRIPPEKIVKDYAPDDQAHLFVLAGTIQCFVRPKGGI